MKKGKNNAEKKAACAAGACLILTMALLAYGYWFREKKTENILTMASYKASIVEKYTVPDHVDPSGSVEKRVSVKNEGTVGIFVRVSVTGEFGTQTEDGFQKDTSLDPGVIKIVFNQTSWEEKNGWFYYKEILKAGETTKEPLMESFTLSEEAGNEYRRKNARIVVCMESVQAEGGALTVWGITEKDLGVSYPDIPQAKTTGVKFLGQKQGFRIDAENTDLFSAFKNLLPGCARTQKITVTNGSENEAELFLRAEETNAQGKTKKQTALIKKLLETYAVIKITGTDGVIYEGPVCGKSTDATMQKNICLGSFAPGESRELTVSLSLSPEMDNEYEELTGQVDWVFSAKGEDDAAVETTVPQTGDKSRTGLWAALAVSALTAYGLARRRKREEST